MNASPQSDVNQSASLGGSDKPTITHAFPPFNDPKADLIIRSSDNVHFYVHKSLLSIVSPVFEGMLALPMMLLKNLTITALAYPSNPSLRAFTIAIRFRLDKVAQQAARATLRVPLVIHSSIPFKHISAFALQNLHNYHFKCKTAVRKFLATDSWTEAMKCAAHHLMGEAKSHTHGLEYFSLKRLPLATGSALWLPTEHTAHWWSVYVELMMYMLNDWPSGSMIPRLSKLEGIQQCISIEKCRGCKNYGCTRLEYVIEYLASKIEEEVSKIPFVVKY